MAAPNQPIPLDVYAMNSNSNLIKASVFSLFEANNVLMDLPLVTDPTLYQDFMRWIDNLPAVSWVPANTDPVLTYGKPTPMQEKLFIVRNRFKLDATLKQDKMQYQDPLTAQWDAWQRALAYDINFKFFWNDPTNYWCPNVAGGPGAVVPYNQLAFTGLAARISNPLYRIPSNLLINAGGVDLSPSGTTATTAGQYESYIQQAFDSLGAPNGEDCVIYQNVSVKRQWERGIKAQGAGGGFNMTTDAFDRKIKTFQDAKLRYPGRMVDQTTEILTTTETAAGINNGTSSYASTFVVRYGAKYTSGWQPDALKPLNLGRDPTTGASYNVVALWGCGIRMESIYSVARIYNIKGQ